MGRPSFTIHMPLELSLWTKPTYDLVLFCSKLSSATKPRQRPGNYKMAGPIIIGLAQ